MIQQRNIPNGFTIVELLVAIGIIGAIVALTMPAVQHSREAGRRITCQNNLRSQVLALQMFHEARRRLPPGNYLPYEREHAWSTYILPYLEGGHVYHRIDLRKRWSDAGGNYETTRASFPVFRCPSALYREPGDTDYGGIRGSGATGAGKDTVRNGVLPMFVRGDRFLRLNDITDGQSNTICIAESADRFEFHVGNWANGWNSFVSNGLVSVHHGEIFSHHPGGALAARVDGSVMFLPIDIDSYIVGALCTRNGGEVPDEQW